jgi:transcriptional regulator with XRE-family HTH domain
MPKKSRLKLIALPLSSETPGQHLARVRKERGYTQVELAQRTGLIQNAGIGLRTKAAAKCGHDPPLRHGAGSEHRRATATGRPKPLRKPSRRVLRRLDRIESLPPGQQSVLLKTIDTFLENADLKSARR